jgi:hypothetical protein
MWVDCIASTPNKHKGNAGKDWKAALSAGHVYIKFIYLFPLCQVPLLIKNTHAQFLTDKAESWLTPREMGFDVG